MIERSTGAADLRPRLGKAVAGQLRAAGADPRAAAILSTTAEWGLNRPPPTVLLEAMATVVSVHRVDKQDAPAVALNEATMESKIRRGAQRALAGRGGVCGRIIDPLIIAEAPV